MQVAIRQFSRASRSYTYQVFNALLVSREKGVEYSRDENGPAFMGFDYRSIHARIRLVVQRGPQSLARPCRITELARQFHETVWRPEVATLILDLISQQILEGEMLKQRHDIGETFVKS